MVKKIIFWGKLKRANYNHNDYKSYFEQKWNNLRTSKSSHLSFEVEPRVPMQYEGRNIKNINLELYEIPNSDKNAKNMINNITAIGTGYQWWEISVPEAGWENIPQITTENNDSVRIVNDNGRNPTAKIWKVTDKDIVFTCYSQPRDLKYTGTGTIIPIGSMRVEEGNEVLASPVVDSILLKNVYDRKDIENGIERGKKYVIKGASTSDFAISGPGVHGDYNNNRELTLYIENASKIIDENKTSSSTESTSHSTDSTNNNEDTSVNSDTNENQTNDNNNQSSDSGIPFHKPIDKEREAQEAYNKQYFWGKHSDLVEFEEARQKLNNSYVLRTDKEDHRQIREKEKNLHNFKSLFSNMTANEVEAAKSFNETELSKRKELTGLMKAVMSDIDKNSTFPEMPYGPADELKSLREETVQTITNALDQEPKVKGSDLYEENIPWRQSIFAAKSASEITSIKDKVLDDIKSKRELKISAASLGESLQKAKNGNTDDLKEAIKKAEQENGRQSYEENKSEVEDLKERLLNNSKEEYGKMMGEVIDNILKSTETSENELGIELQEKIKKLKDPNLDEKELKAISEELVSEVNRKGWQNWAKKKLTKAKELIRKAKTKVTQEVVNDLKKVRDDWNKFIYDKSSYKESAFQASEKDIKETLNKIDKMISENQNVSAVNDNKVPLGIIVPVSLAVVALIGIVAVVVVRKRKQSKIKQSIE